MVAFYVPPDKAQELAGQVAPLFSEGDKIVPPDEMNLTLGYMGKVGTILASKREVGEVLDALSREWKSLPGKLNGTGQFNIGSYEVSRSPWDLGNDGYPFYANFDSPQLPALRQQLADALARIDASPMQNHGYTPGEGAPDIRSGQC